jgi:hypothetical protein
MNSDAIDRSARIAAFQHWFGISGAQASVLLHLFLADGGFRTAGQLAVVESSSTDAMKMRIARLRSAMDTEAIDWAEGCGYSLTTIGQGECKRAITEFVISLRGSAA